MYKIEFKGTRDEIKEAIVDSGHHTNIRNTFIVPRVPDFDYYTKLPETIRSQRMSFIKRIKDDLMLDLKEAKDLGDYVLSILKF